jgi:hypothetical protein
MLMLMLPSAALAASNSYNSIKLQSIANRCRKKETNNARYRSKGNQNPRGDSVVSRHKKEKPALLQNNQPECPKNKATKSRIDV